jgi:hypothetical protein
MRSALLFAAASFILLPAPAVGDEKLNVVLILADDKE